MEINSKTNFNNETSYFWGKPDISVKFCEKNMILYFGLLNFIILLALLFIF